VKRVLIVGLGVAGTAALSKLLGDSKAKSEVEVDVCEIKERPWTFLSCGELVPDPDFLSKYVPENIKTVLRESHKFQLILIVGTAIKTLYWIAILTILHVSIPIFNYGENWNLPRVRKKLPVKFNYSKTVR